MWDIVNSEKKIEDLTKKEDIVDWKRKNDKAQNNLLHIKKYETTSLFEIE